MKHKCSYCGNKFNRTYSKGHEPKRSFCDIQCFKAWKRKIPLHDLKKPTEDEIKFMKVFAGKHPTPWELKQFLADEPAKTKGWS